MAINACGVVIGPRGIVSPRITPKVPATAVAIPIPIHARDTTGRVPGPAGRYQAPVAEQAPVSGVDQEFSSQSSDVPSRLPA